MALERREYGRTGRMLSVVGFGGIIVRDMAPDRAARVVAEAIERGVNYFDVAPSYGDAEVRLGPALAPYRDGVFLACKASGRTADETAADLDRSLERLGTDYLDLYQLHALIDVAKDVDVAFGPGGAMETFVQARADGRVRHLGFSAHTTEAALQRYQFDSVLFPVNFACWLRSGFGEKAVAEAKRQGVARLALKAMAMQKWPDGHPDRQTYRKCWYQPTADRRLAGLALRFALGQPVTAAVSPGDGAMLSLMLDVAEDLRPLAEDELCELRAVAEEAVPIFTEPER